MDMTPGLPPLTWDAFFHTRQLNLGWLLFCVAAATGYLVALGRARRRGGMPVHPVRVVSFLLGLLLLAWCLSSAIDGYAMALFWVHMVEHLSLITVVPALLVLGSPLTVLRAAGGERWQAGFDRVVQHGPVALLTHPLVGLLVYSSVIFYTHLTPFMDRMMVHPWLMPAEQVAYVVSGWMLLVGTIGDEPIRWHTPYLFRIVILVAAMIPDTLVGLALMQATTVPFPEYMMMRPSWAAAPLDDLDTAGSLMWVGGDGLMMVLAVGVVVALLSGHGRDQFLGTWLESVRTQNFDEQVGRSGGDAGARSTGRTIDDDDAALDAYNAMLRRLDRSDQGPDQER